MLARVPRDNAERVAAAIRTIFFQPDAERVHEQFDTEDTQPLILPLPGRATVAVPAGRAASAAA